MSTQDSLQGLQSQAINLLRRHRNEEEIPTDVLREVAEIFVQARELFLTRDGQPDWRGTTYAYRVWNGEVIRGAGLSPNMESRVQASIRYHVGNILRERLDDETLESLGLRKKSPRERSTEKHERQMGVVNLFSGGPVIADAEDFLQALGLMEKALRRVDPNAVARAANADDLTSAIERILNRLRSIDARLLSVDGTGVLFVGEANDEGVVVRRSEKKAAPSSARKTKAPASATGKTKAPAASSGKTTKTVSPKGTRVESRPR